MSNNNEIRNTTGDSQSPQASASTNSATRALSESSIVGGVSQEISDASSSNATEEKFPEDKFSSNFRIDGVGNQSADSRRGPDADNVDKLVSVTGAALVDRVRARAFWNKMAVDGECWLWPRTRSSNGYGSTSWAGKWWPTHRLAWHLANGRVHDPLPRSIQVRHKCDVKVCCNPGHLEPGTANDNAQDAVRRGRTNGGKPRGVSHAAKRHLIFELAERGVPKMDIARELGMTERNVHYHLSKGKR